VPEDPRPTPARARVCVIVNPHAGSSDGLDALRAGAPRGVAFRDCDGEVELADLAHAAALDGFEVVAAAGGDGTVHAVAAGLMREPPARRPALAVVPLGTGNDFARTLALPLDNPGAALVRATKPEAVRALDVIHVQGDGIDTWAVNVCAGGFSGAIDEVLSPELKARWGPLAYLIGTVRAFPELKDYDTRVAFDDAPPERIDALNIVVANGRTAAGGRPAAPRANPEDGLLDIVIILQSTALDIARLAARVFAGDYLTDEHIVHRQVRRLAVTSRPGMWFNVDGELLSKEPLTFEAEPRALRVVVGEDYRPDPEPAGVAKRLRRNLRSRNRQ
jgi:diacylglycerol kinase (ATP)